jgi:tRNA dimethylallyltransferase
VSKEKTLIVIAGPTASGKTDLSLLIAKHYNTCILSADSRQFYKEMKIGTASPSAEVLSEIPHYFIGHLSIHDNYNVSSFETEALTVLDECFQTKDVVVACGGSGLYLDALCYGIDELPDPDPELRNTLNHRYEKEGLSSMLNLLRELDPEYYEIVDKKNPQRILRALEVCLQTNKSYTSQRTRTPKKRNFNIQKYCLSLPRNVLNERINQRTEEMMEAGLLAEAQSLYPYRHLNALKTVGYKELFDFMDKKCSLEESVEKIKTHTRRYAKRQITWFKRDSSYQWASPEEIHLELTRKI